MAKGNTAVLENPESTAADVAAAAPVPKKKVEPISAGRIKSGEFIRTLYVGTAFPNTVPLDLLEPEYWAHFAATLRPRDRLEMWADDGSWLAEYVVLGATKNAATIRMINAVELDPIMYGRDDTGPLAAYEVRHRGLVAQWSVIRKTDGAVIHEGEATESGARLYLTQHLHAFK